jgi:hypothetical protein
MKKLVVDATLREQLKPPLELTDETGQTVGYFISRQQFDRIAQLEEDRKALYEWANSLVTDEELDAADAEGGDISHEAVTEFLRKLEALERSMSA